MSAADLPATRPRKKARAEEPRPKDKLRTGRVGEKAEKAARGEKAARRLAAGGGAGPSGEFTHGHVSFRVRGRERGPLPGPQELASRQTRQAVLRDHADVTVVSYPKSGRTWLSHMTTSFTAYFLGAYEEAKPQGITGEVSPPELRESYLTAFFAARRAGRAAPLIQFEHLNSPNVVFMEPRTVNVPETPRYVLLIRDPRDVVVSDFHHVTGKHGGRAGTDADRILPADLEISEFVLSFEFGIRKIIDYIDHWTAWAKHSGALVVHYEDLQRRPVETLTEMFRFSGFSHIDRRHIEKVLEETKFEKMKATEFARKVALGKPSDDAHLRARKGEVGGYRNELTPDVSALLTRIMERSGVAALARYLAPA